MHIKMAMVIIMAKDNRDAGHWDKEKGKAFRFVCPMCDAKNTLRRTKGNSRQPQGCYKCSECNAELFEYEVEEAKEYYSLGIFRGQDGEKHFVHMTKDWLEKRHGTSKQSANGKVNIKRPKGLSRKDKNMLKRLKDNRK